MFRCGSTWSSKPLRIGSSSGASNSIGRPEERFFNSTGPKRMFDSVPTSPKPPIAEVTDSFGYRHFCKKSARRALRSGGAVSIRAPIFSTCAQIERQRDPRATVKNQVDAYEKTDHPKPRDGPLRENEKAEQKCDGAVQCLPAPAWQGNSE